MRPQRPVGLCARAGELRVVSRDLGEDLRDSRAPRNAMFPVPFRIDPQPDAQDGNTVTRTVIRTYQVK